MKFLSKKLIKICSPVVMVSPLFFVASCGASKSLIDFNASSDNKLYSTIWNLALTQENNIITKSLFNLTVQELEDKINDLIKKDSKKNFMLKLYCFQFLWKAIKEPLSDSGTIQSNLSPEITDFSTFLSNKMAADNKEETINDKKTYNEFKKYLNTFDYRISFVNINDKGNGNISLDKSQTLRDIFSTNKYILNFQFDFWTSDAETNEKVVSKKNDKKSIMYKNYLSRKQRIILNSITDANIKEMTMNQFTYQSTKLYYNLDTKKFSSIVLPTNVYPGLIENTINSGFSAFDKKRELIEISWYSGSAESSSFSTHINFLFNTSSNFNTSLNSDWTNFLKKEGIIKEGSKPDKMMINLDINFDFNIKDLE